MTDKMREEFETYAKSQYASLRRDSSGDYWVETTQSAWEAWQASREAVEIELKPPHNDYAYGDSYVEGAVKYYEQVKKVIQRVGLKIK